MLSCFEYERGEKKKKSDIFCQDRKMTEDFHIIYNVQLGEVSMNLVCCTITTRTRHLSYVRCKKIKIFDNIGEKRKEKKMRRSCSLSCMHSLPATPMLTRKKTRGDPGSRRTMVKIAPRYIRCGSKVDSSR